MLKIPVLFLCGALAVVGAASARAQQSSWSSNYAKAAAQAKTENKPILLDFTGSDWCRWCMKMKKEALDTPQFGAYAKQNLVLMTVDSGWRYPVFSSVESSWKACNCCT
jgi:thiol:disulfide interchange protein